MGAEKFKDMGTRGSAFFEDMARMASGAAGSVLEMRREMESFVTAQIEKFLRKMEFVTREEFEVVRAMAAAAREENAALAARLAALESSPKGPSETPKSGVKS